jgi:hypothetical protein
MRACSSIEAADAKAQCPMAMVRTAEEPRQRPIARDVLVQCRSSMRIPAAVVCACLALFCLPAHAFAQDPPPPLPRMVFDVRGSTTNFSVEPELAQSRGLLASELPGRGFGGDVALHFYLLKLKGVTFGLGGQVSLARAATSGTVVSDQTIVRPVTEQFTSATAQLSFNFGSGNGWSYISGGIGPAQRTVIPAGGGVSVADAERLLSLNYGAGARWFIKRHVAFTFDVRWHQLSLGTAVVEGLVPSPRSTLLIMSAGVSLK